jgi:hypothetical protein
MSLKFKVYGLPKSEVNFALAPSRVDQVDMARYNAKALEVLRGNGFKVLDADDPELLELRGTFETPDGNWVLRACWSSHPDWKATQADSHGWGYWAVEIFCKRELETELHKKLVRINRGIMDRLGIKPVNPDYGKF